MLVELSVSGLGVIDELALVFPAGMVALTGETGAGKTLVVTAIELLVGGRADAVLVGSDRSEAVVEGRFLHDGEERILRRVLPASGRSRAYVDGHMATVGELADLGRQLVDLHGQHSHQSLLSTPAQRRALDQFAGIDLGPLQGVRDRVAALGRELEGLGGDSRARVRELDLLEHQIAELDGAALRPGELSELEAEEGRLADAAGHRSAAQEAAELLSGDEGAAHVVARAASALRGRPPHEALAARVAGLQAELEDAGRDLARWADAAVDDPDRLAEVRDRLGLLHGLARKYGGSTEEMFVFLEQARRRREELAGHEERAAQLTGELDALVGDVTALEADVGQARREAAPRLAAAVAAHLADLALAGAAVGVAIGAEDPGDDVEFRFAADPGGPALPLRKVASGGELARIMLALRLVLTAGPDTLVFDEVDAGIGGTAAQAVGRALAALAPAHQVLVVTHLAQVAAHADSQVLVAKEQFRGRTRTGARVLDPDERLTELARMLSGASASGAARQHAAELLAVAGHTGGR